MIQELQDKNMKSDYFLPQPQLKDQIENGYQLKANKCDVNDEFEKIYYHLTEDVEEEYETLFNDPQPVTLDDRLKNVEQSKQSESEKVIEQDRIEEKSVFSFGDSTHKKIMDQIRYQVKSNEESAPSLETQKWPDAELQDQDVESSPSQQTHELLDENSIERQPKQDQIMSESDFETVQNLDENQLVQDKIETLTYNQTEVIRGSQILIIKEEIKSVQEESNLVDDEVDSKMSEIK